MAGSIYRHTGGNKSKDEQRYMERDYGGDLINIERDDDYNLELYPEYYTHFITWAIADERRELIRDVTTNKERNFMK